MDSRQLGGGIVVSFGILAFISGLWLNPVVGRAIKGPLVDNVDVLLTHNKRMPNAIVAK